jgi:copper chaperone CopZ
MARMRRVLPIAQAVAGVAAIAWLAVMANAQPEIQDVTLKLGGQSCDAYIVKVESALLRLRGVTTVDIEARKGHVIVGYDASKVSIPQILQTVANQKGKDWFCTAQLASGQR